MTSTPDLLHEPDPTVSFTSLTAAWCRQVRVYGESMRAYRAASVRRLRVRQAAAPERRLASRAASAMLPRRPDREPRAESEHDGAGLAEAVALSVVEANREPPRVSRLAPIIADVPGLPRRQLTRRQIEIAQLIAEGLTNVQIAQRLVLTPGTVGNHVEHILRRLGMSNRAQVAAWVARDQASAPVTYGKPGVVPKDAVE